MFYYGLIGFVSATLRLILCFVFSFLFSSRSDVSLAGPLDEVFGGFTATVHLSNRDFNPVVLTAYSIFLTLLRDTRSRRRESIPVVRKRWFRVAQYARAVGSYAMFMKRSRNRQNSHRRRPRDNGNEEEETKFSSSSSSSDNVEKLKQEIERLRHELNIADRRHKQLVPVQKSGGPGLPGPLSRYRRHHDGVSEPRLLPLGARIENLEVQ